MIIEFDRLKPRRSRTSSASSAAASYDILWIRFALFGQHIFSPLEQIIQYILLCRVPPSHLQPVFWHLDVAIFSSLPPMLPRHTRPRCALSSADPLKRVGALLPPQRSGLAIRPRHAPNKLELGLAGLRLCIRLGLHRRRLYAAVLAPRRMSGMRETRPLRRGRARGLLEEVQRSGHFAPHSGRMRMRDAFSAQSGCRVR